MAILCTTCQNLICSDKGCWDCKESEKLSLSEGIDFYQDQLVYECSQYIQEKEHVLMGGLIIIGGYLLICIGVVFLSAIYIPYVIDKYH